MRADDLVTKREVLTAFSAAGSARVMFALVTAATAGRIVAGGWSLVDTVVIAVSVGLVGIVEWCIHLFLLHAPVGSLRMRVLKTGVGHRQHHLDPSELSYVLLGPIDTAVFGVMIAGGTAAWTMPLALVVGGEGLMAAWLTGLLFAYLSLAHYEWTHLLVHTRYRPRTRFYRRLARNHRLHHYRNERYWLGVTSNVGDRVFGSYPRSRSDVPLSATARNLA
ncbi:MAG: sterol desaturase family protein [Acidimicrobiales bacterium]|nr:sterol desaturase family protein [Acidimicrobiales bacterium]